MAQTVHLTLTVNGKVIQGESTQHSEGRKDTIECVYFESGITTPRNPSTGAATGRRQHSPLKLRKLLDKATPEIAKALCQNTSCTAKFDFYRPKGEGSDDLFFTVELTNAYVADVRLIMPDTFENPAAETREPYEEVTFTFDAISWTYSKGASHEDSWSGAK